MAHSRCRRLTAPVPFSAPVRHVRGRKRHRAGSEAGPALRMSAEGTIGCHRPRQARAGATASGLKRPAAPGGSRFAHAVRSAAWRHSSHFHIRRHAVTGKSGSDATRAVLPLSLSRTNRCDRQIAATSARVEFWRAHEHFIRRGGGSPEGFPCRLTQFHPPRRYPGDPGAHRRAVRSPPVSARRPHPTGAEILRRLAVPPRISQIVLQVCTPAAWKHPARVSAPTWPPVQPSFSTGE